MTSDLGRECGSVVASRPPGGSTQHGCSRLDAAPGMDHGFSSIRSTPSVPADRSCCCFLGGDESLRLWSQDRPVNRTPAARWRSGPSPLRECCSRFWRRRGLRHCARVRGGLHPRVPRHHRPHIGSHSPARGCALGDEPNERSSAGFAQLPESRRCSCSSALRRPSW